MGVECAWENCEREFETELAMKTHHSKTHNESIRGTEVTCSWCGTRFRKRSDHAEKHDHHFCNDSCEGKWRSINFQGDANPRWNGGKETVQCSSCGAEIERNASKAERRNRFFCDFECMATYRSKHLGGDNSPRWNREIVECAACGSELKRPQHDLEANQRHFCDRDCMGDWRAENQVGENSSVWKPNTTESYGPHWTEQRHKARKRDDFSCQVCGLRDTDHIARFDTELHVHHIIPRRKFADDAGNVPAKANILSNLITVCNPCHQELETEPAAVARHYLPNNPPE